MVYFVSRLIFKFLLKALCGLEIKGKENLPDKGPFIVASNHASYIDPAVLGVACDTTPLIFMAKRELFTTPVFNWWFKAVKCIPIERDSKSFKPMKWALQKLKEGKTVGIFPEGTRSPDGRLQKPGLGIGLLALKSGAPIVPVCLAGTDKVLPKGKKFITPNKVTAKIGKMIVVDRESAFLERKKAYKAIGEKTMTAIAHLKSE